MSLKDLPQGHKTRKRWQLQIWIHGACFQQAEKPLHSSILCACVGEEKGKVSHNSRSGNRLIISFSVSVSTHHQSECVKQSTYGYGNAVQHIHQGFLYANTATFSMKFKKITSLCSISADSDKLLEKQKGIFWNSLKNKKINCQRGSVGIWRPAVYTTLSSPLLCHCSLMYSHLSERHCENSLLWKSNVFVVR